MIRAAIVGASGYTGVELVRILAGHPHVRITAVTSEQSAGKRLSDIFPSLRGVCDMTLSPLDPERICGVADLIVTALPHEEAMRVVPHFLSAGKRVIDLSADFRLREPSLYGEWYAPHTAPDLLGRAVYGIPELHRARISAAELVANPGCYPTSIILGVAPLLEHRIIDTTSIICDSASGVSGAGRGAKVDSLFCEVNDSFRAYGVGGVHRHIPEIEQELSLLARERVVVTFTPHLVPMDRGILSTIYASPAEEVTEDRLRELYRERYADEPFVRVLPKGEFPSTGAVRGSNRCDIGVTVDRRTNRLIVVSAIDNLVKGASGQAVQNLNLVCGFPETTALPTAGLFP